MSASKLQAVVGSLSDWRFNRDDVDLTTYVNAVKRNSFVRFAADFLRFGVTKRIGEYTHPDERVKAWVDDAVLPRLLDAVPEMLWTVYYGAMLAEPRWDTRTGELRLARVVVAHPELWWSGQPTRDEQTGELKAWRLITGETVEIYDSGKRRKVAHWAWGGDFGNAWGDPAARRVYGWEALLKRYLTWEGIATEVSALARVVLFHTGDNDRGEELCDAITQLGMNGAVAFPATEVSDLRELKSLGGGSPFDVQIRRCLQGIFAAFYQPSLLSMEAQFGTRAQASTQLEAYLGTETAIAEELVRAVLMEQFIVPALALQFGPTTEPGDLQVKDPAPPDLVQWSSILQGLWQTGFVQPDTEDAVAWAAERFGVPREAMIEHPGIQSDVAGEGEGALRPGQPVAPPEEVTRA